MQRHCADELSLFAAHHIRSALRVRARYTGYDSDGVTSRLESQQTAGERLRIHGARDVCGFFPAIARANHAGEIGGKWAVLARPGCDKLKESVVRRRLQC